MHSSIRQMTGILLLTVLLAPGLAHARTAPTRSKAPARAAALPELGISGSATSVWNLLTNFLKTGGQMDPNGGIPGAGTATTSNGTGDTGGQMDPNGTPK